METHKDNALGWTHFYFCKGAESLSKGVEWLIVLTWCNSCSPYVVEQ